MTKQTSCEERIKKHFENRISDLEKLWNTNKEDPEKGVEGLGTFSEYGLSFDYVSPNTFKNQKRGYFRYQLSWGGPSDEFRFFCDENLETTEIEYWFLDWFDGSHLTLACKEYYLLSEIFRDFKDTGTVQAKLNESRNE